MVSPATTFRLLATYPLALTYGRYWAQFGTLSPLVIGLLPFLIYMPRQERCASKLAALSVGRNWPRSHGCAVSGGLHAALFLANLLMLGIPAAAAGDVQPAGRMALHLVAVGVARCASDCAGPGGRTVTPRFRCSPRPDGSCATLTNDLLGSGGLAPYERAEHALNALAAPGDRIFLFSYYRYWLRPDLLLRVDPTADPRPFSSRPQLLPSCILYISGPSFRRRLPFHTPETNMFPMGKHFSITSRPD